MKVLIETSKGKILVEINKNKAPITVANFLRYIEFRRYNGTVFHRVKPGFVIQGGILTPEIKNIDLFSPIQLESINGLSNIKGTIGMARSAEPNSATASFFINVVDNTRLDYQSDDKPGYAVFGKVIKGMDVVELINQVNTGDREWEENDETGVMHDWPLEEIVINRISLVENNVQ